MEKTEFLLLLANSATLTTDEAKALVRLQDEFPYSQAIHNLAARGCQLNQLPSGKAQLGKAAIYATDRSVLKAIISAPGKPRETLAKPPSPATAEKPQPRKAPAVPETRPGMESAQAQGAKEGAKGPSEEKFTPSGLSGDALLDELYHDLDKLKELKYGFEVASAGFDSMPPPPPPANKKNEAPGEAKGPKETTKSLLDDIKSTKRQKEQLEIIDRFIKAKPSIGKGKMGASGFDTADLSERSSAFTDNIVSETLVEILIKQGKKGKAVEVLRKLIWKYKKKKAYFAAQIDELTN